MSLDALNVARVLGLAAYGLLYWRSESLPTWAHDAQYRITQGQVFDFVRVTAQKMGFQGKEIVVIDSSGIGGYGMNLMPGPAYMLVPKNSSVADPKSQQNIIAALYTIKTNQVLKSFFIPLISVIAFHILFKFTYPSEGVIAECGVLFGIWFLGKALWRESSLEYADKFLKERQVHSLS